MPGITKLGPVIVPVSDQDAGIAFYTGKLGFSLVADVPMGPGERWIEVGPPGGGPSISLGPPRGDFQPGRSTGVTLLADDAAAVHADLKAKGVDVDEELIGGDGTVPLLFFFRDHEGNQLTIAQG
jgi:catechol 2,3-dioxygenase-like lactoylglutathione lyase family enzyme